MLFQRKLLLIGEYTLNYDRDPTLIWGIFPNFPRLELRRCMRQLGWGPALEMCVQWPDILWICSSPSGPNGLGNGHNHKLLSDLRMNSALDKLAGMRS